ncbi:MAG: NAD(+)/NADH kinase [Pseudomonadales bacterium]|nr:NAD(+)/NADH kinase [Pseudomonadales bacterium]
MTEARVAILVNPMSGRDVRRLAARATNMTHEAKRDIVARVAAGADACGATDIFVAREPFRIAAAALEYMGLGARTHVLTPPIRNTAEDTETAVNAFLEAGCDTIVSLGGDGTNRAIVRALGARAERVRLIPLSTGTNNVFPVLAEPTIAGMVAGLQARGLLTGTGLEARCKVLHVSGVGRYGLPVHDLGLIDAVLLRRDHVGNLLPFDADRIDRLLLTRAEPASIGMSPIGGLIEPVDAADDAGLLVEMGPGTRLRAPLSPGLFREVSVSRVTRVPLGQPVEFAGEGVLAFDGDRDHKIPVGATLAVAIRRDGPWIVDIAAAMRWAVEQRLLLNP